MLTFEGAIARHNKGGTASGECAKAAGNRVIGVRNVCIVSEAAYLVHTSQNDHHTPTNRCKPSFSELVLLIITSTYSRSLFYITCESFPGIRLENLQCASSPVPYMSQAPGFCDVCIDQPFSQYIFVARRSMLLEAFSPLPLSSVMS